jgi:hypothetical protein
MLEKGVSAGTHQAGQAAGRISSLPAATGNRRADVACAIVPRPVANDASVIVNRGYRVSGSTQGTRAACGRISAPFAHAACQRAVLAGTRGMT